MIGLRTLGVTVGYLLAFGVGILMLYLWFVSLGAWLGFWGIILAFILLPGFVVFPVVFWLVEGAFPTGWFVLWGIGWFGMTLAGACLKNGSFEGEQKTKEEMKSNSDHCQLCRGYGVVKRNGKSIKCSDCQGTGWSSSPSRQDQIANSKNTEVPAPEGRTRLASKEIRASESVASARPYRWGRIFGALLVIVSVLGFLLAGLRLSLGAPVDALFYSFLSLLLGLQAWGLLKKRKAGLVLYYFLCAFMLIDLLLEYAYMPLVGESPNPVSWVYATLYLASAPYFFKRYHDFH